MQQQQERGPVDQGFRHQPPTGPLAPPPPTAASDKGQGGHTRDPTDPALTIDAGYGFHVPIRDVAVPHFASDGTREQISQPGGNTFDTRDPEAASRAVDERTAMLSDESRLNEDDVDTVGIALGDLRAGAVGFRGANKPSFVGRELAGRAHAPKAEGGFAPRKEPVTATVSSGSSIDVGGAGGLSGDDIHGKSAVAGDFGGGAAIFGSQREGAPYIETVVPGQGVSVSGASSEAKGELIE